MTTSQKTFEQVKSILGKLDQRIDALRERRSVTPLTPVPAPHAAALAPAAAPAIPHLAVAAAPAPIASIAPAPPSRSPYGRATPIRRQA